MKKFKIGQGLAAALVVAVAEIAVLFGGSMATMTPANAQFFFEDRYPFIDQRRRNQRMFDPLFQDEPAPRVDYSRAPAARKSDVVPTTKILVVGDSMADWLAYGLDDALSETPELGVVRKPRIGSGLIRYDGRGESPTWAQSIRDLIAAERPQAIIMMVGIQDRQAMRESAAPVPAKDTKTATPAPGDQKQAAAPKPGEQKPAEQKPGEQKLELKPSQTADDEQNPNIAGAETAPRGRPGSLQEFRSERWEELYARRIDETIAAMKVANVPIIWVGLPSIRGPKSTSDMVYLNEFYRSRADNAGIVYVDVWDGFVDDSGRFTTQGPDFEGQIRRLRAADGVHFTKSGARKLAHYAERELRRMLTAPVAPVALPAPEVTPQAPAKPGATAARPLAGPVLLLTNSNEDNDELLGASANRSPAPDPVAASVLVKGEAIATAAGRADDFSWPPRVPNTKVDEPLPPSGPPIAFTKPVPAVHRPVQTSQAGLPARPAQQALPPGARPAGPPPGWRAPPPPSYYGPPRGFFGLFR
jgi:hypothetical protein